MKIKVAIEHGLEYISLCQANKHLSLSKGSPMKIIIATLIALASFSFAGDDLDGRKEGVEVSFQIPTPKIERDTVAHVTKPKEITRFNEYVQIGQPIEVENGIKAELAYLPWF